MSFIIYSFIGWLWETFYCSLKAKHFVYRGFLLGPYCPVYGFGVTLVLLLAPKGNEPLLSLYFNVIVIVTFVEFIASYLLEKIFKLTLWDYKDIPFNIEGRVAIPVSLFWGVGCLFLIKIINPMINDLIGNFLEMTNNWGAYILLLLFASDVVSTISFSLKDKVLIANALPDHAENQSIKEFRFNNLFKHRNHKNRQTLKAFIEDIKIRSPHIKHLNRLINNYPNIDFVKKLKK
ncbi:hypothetical protein HOY36_03615 [Enterococcus sp. MMGLQ5-2]|nr:hypothetical protein [Enterococcus sp. MMGLQ5-2]MBS7583891.1 hypothetical protein [Enterococcus sp. MMGLQ5-1]NPD11752.1 hypothetical protein [Enterococcus sp. MMGLQ5-1]NPD36459.1 hypothetical protein [Enterococcus sp. MMGLQ5-2]